MKQQLRWINTEVILQWNPDTQSYDEVSTQGYWYDGPMALAHNTPNYDQDSYAWYNDGTESGSTIIGTANTSQTLNADTTYLIRFLIQEDNGGTGNNNSFQLEYDVNNSGTWNNVTSTSNSVRAVASGNLTEGGNTTQRLGAGTFITTNAGVDSGDGAAGNISFAGNDEAEVLYAVQLRSADLSNNDTVQLRVQTINTFTNTANATVSIPDNKFIDFVTPTGLTISNQTMSLNLEKQINFTTPTAMTITNGSLTVDQQTGTEVTLTSDSLSISNGTLSVNDEVTATLTGEALSISDGTISVNDEVTATLTGDTLSITDGTMSVAGGLNISLVASSLTITDGSLFVSQEEDIVLIPDSLTITDGTLSVFLEEDIVLTPDSLSLSDGVMTVQVNIDLNVSTTPDSLSITDGSVEVLSAKKVDLLGDTLTISSGSMAVLRAIQVNMVEESLIIGGPSTVSVFYLVRPFDFCTDEAGAQSTATVVSGATATITATGTAASPTRKVEVGAASANVTASGATPFGLSTLGTSGSAIQAYGESCNSANRQVFPTEENNNITVYHIRERYYWIETSQLITPTVIFYVDDVVTGDVIIRMPNTIPSDKFVQIINNSAYDVSVYSS